MSRRPSGQKLDRDWLALIDALPDGARVSLSVHVRQDANVTVFGPVREGGRYLGSAIEDTPARALAVALEQVWERRAAPDVSPAELGGFEARNDELQIAAYGDTEEAAIASFRESVAALVAFCTERQIPLPPALAAARS